MPRTALGRARLARCDDFVSRPLDFQYYHRVLKFHIPGARFRDRRIWRDRSATEAGGRCRIATPLPLSHSTCATNAGLTAWVAWGALVAKRASGRPDPQGRLGRVGRCGRRAARVNWRLQRESESITRRVQRPCGGPLRCLASGSAASSTTASTSSTQRELTWPPSMCVTSSARAHAAASERSGAWSASPDISMTYGLLRTAGRQ